MSGLSPWNYGRTVHRFGEVHGIEIPAVSEQFVEANPRKVRELVARELRELDLGTTMMDSISFDDEKFVVALSIRKGGRKTVLGLHQGTSASAVVRNHGQSAGSADVVEGAGGAMTGRSASRC